MNNDSIIAEIICPATSRTYDFVIYTHMKIYDTIKKISDEIMEFELNPELFHDIDMLQLFSASHGAVLVRNLKICDYDLKSGCRLMLV